MARSILPMSAIAKPTGISDTAGELQSRKLLLPGAREGDRTHKRPVAGASRTTGGRHTQNSTPLKAPYSKGLLVWA